MRKGWVVTQRGPRTCWLAVLSWGLLACSARTVLIGGGSAGPAADASSANDAAGIDGPVPVADVIAQASDLAAPWRLTASDALLLHEELDDTPDALADPRQVDLLWTGSRFAVLLRQHIGERVVVTLRFVDLDPIVASPTVEVSDETAATAVPRSQTMALRGGALAVLWSRQDYEARFRRVGLDGELPAPSLRAFGHSRLITFETMAVSSDGFVAAWTLSDSAHLTTLSAAGAQLFVDHIDSSGISGRGGQLVFGGMASVQDVYAVAYVARPGLYSVNQDRLLVAFIRIDGVPERFDGVPGGGSLIVRSEDGVAGGSLVAAGDRAVIVGATIPNHGIVFFHVTPDGQVAAPVALAADSLTLPLLRPGPEYLVAVLAVSAHPQDRRNPRFILADPASGAVHAEVLLAPGAASDCFVESKDLARAGEQARYGAAWIERCGAARRWLFAEIARSR